MNNRIRIYGKTVNTWKALESFNYRGQEQEREVITQREVEYREYDEDGDLVAAGTEDFSRDRYREIDEQWVWVWDGQKRNKGGHRWFECKGSIKFNLNQKKDVFKYLRRKYSNAEIIQLRMF